MSDFNLDQEINYKLDKFGKATHDALEVAKKNRNDLEEHRLKSADESAKLLEQINVLKSVKEDQEKKLLELEKRLTRPSVGGEKIDECRLKYGMELDQYLRKGSPIDNGLYNEITNKIFKKSNPYSGWVKKDMLEGINPDGGYWIIPERSSEEITRIFETSPMRQVSNVITTSVNQVDMIINDNEATNGGWVGEISSRPNTDTPEIGLLSIPIFEQYANPRATQRLIDDTSFDLQTWLVNKVQDIITRGENTAFVSGNGVSKPKGFNAYGSWVSGGSEVGDDTTYTRDSLEDIWSGSDTGFTYNGITNLQTALLEDYQANAVWLMHRVMWGNVIQLASTTEFPLINPTDGLRDGFERMLLGKRVIFASDLSSTFTADDTPIAYGDFRRGYTIVDRLGFRVIRDNITAKPYTEYYTTKRVGGAVTNYQSIKRMIISDGV